MTALPVVLYTARGPAAARADAGLCLAGYARAFGLAAPGALIRLPGGKPAVAGGGLHLSVSHSGDIWACAVHTGPVGLDVQLRQPGRPEAAIARRWFVPQEQALLAARPELFYDIWCAKEAWVKYTGQGIARGFRSFSCVEGGGLAPRLGDACRAVPQLEPGYAVCLGHRPGASIQIDAMPAPGI